LHGCETMDNFTFVYKGRYFLKEAETLERLSAIARRNGRRTHLVYDRDIFGAGDNVFNAVCLNALFSSVRGTARKVEPGATAVFLATMNNAGWIGRVIDAINSRRAGIKTIVIAAFEDLLPDVTANHTLIGEPESVFARFLEPGCNAPARLIVDEPADLDALPLPDKELFGGYAPAAESYMIYTGRGCAGSCSYCEETVYKKQLNGYCRRRTPENVMAELVHAQRAYGIKEVLFKDSVFTQDGPWLALFLAAYREKIGVPFKCFAKADAFNETMARQLKDSGCYCVEFGVQTINGDLRRNVLNRRETLEAVRAACLACNTCGLLYDIDHMFGIPHETVEDHKEAARWYASLRGLNRIKCHNLTYYKCADITGYAIAAGDIASVPVDEEAGFFSTPVKKKLQWENRCFQKLFKTLPLLSETSVRALVRGNGWKLFGWAPAALIMIAQLIIALRNNDLRFKVYLKYYPKLLRPGNLKRVYV